MQTTLENLGELSRRLNVAVPLAQIEGEVGKRLARLARTVKVPGFRPGHVPIRMVEQQYGPQVRSDVITDAVQTSFADAIREQNIRVAGYPRIEPAASKTETAPETTLEFSAVFEVYPDIALGDFASATIERPQVEVTPADVDRTLDVLRRQRADFHPATGGAQAGEIGTIHNGQRYTRVNVVAHLQSRYIGQPSLVVLGKSAHPLESTYAHLVEIGRHSVDKVARVGAGRVNPDFGMHLVAAGRVFPHCRLHRLENFVVAQFQVLDVLLRE